MARKDEHRYDALPHFADPRYQTYYVPHTDTPELQRFYDWLLDHGWRFDSRAVEWHAPESSEANGWSVKGRLCRDPDNRRAWIDAPYTRATLLRMLVDDEGTVVGHRQ